MTLSQALRLNSPWLRFVQSGANKKSFLISRPNTLNPSSPTLASSPSRSRIVKDTIFDLLRSEYPQTQTVFTKAQPAPLVFISNPSQSFQSIRQKDSLPSSENRSIAPITSSSIQTYKKRKNDNNDKNLHVDSHFLTPSFLLPRCPAASALPPRRRYHACNDRIHTTRHCLAHC